MQLSIIADRDGESCLIFGRKKTDIEVGRNEKQGTDVIYLIEGNVYLWRNSPLL